MKLRILSLAITATLPGCLLSCSTTKNADGSTTTTVDPVVKSAGADFFVTVLKASELKVLEKISGRKMDTMAIANTVPVTASGK